jgi:hypothetical protein
MFDSFPLPIRAECPQRVFSGKKNGLTDRKIVCGGNIFVTKSTVRRLPRYRTFRAEPGNIRTRAHARGEERERHTRDGPHDDGHSVSRRVRRQCKYFTPSLPQPIHQPPHRLSLSALLPLDGNRNTYARRCRCTL